MPDAPKCLSPLEGSALEFISHRLSDLCATHPVLILLDLVQRLLCSGESSWREGPEARL